MKIIGGKDYYDSARSWGIDSTIVFVRTGREIESVQLYDTFLEIRLEYLKKNAWPHMNTFYVDKGKNEFKYELTPVCLFLCGKRYFGVKVHSWLNQHLGGKDCGYSVIWNLDELRELLKSHDVGFGGRGIGWYNSQVYGRFKDTEHYLSEEFATQASQKEIDWLIENRVTIALYWYPGITPKLYSRQEKAKWIFDTDCLKDVQFWNVMNPTQCFQEIAQWVGGVLPKPGPKMVQITDDKVKIHKAGFDTKLSFRKGKSS